MKNIIASIILLSIALQPQAQTPYTRFIKNKNISWAASYTGPLWFNELNLSLLLRERFAKNEIKAADPDKLAIENHMEYISLKNVLLKIDPVFEESDAPKSDPLFADKYYPGDINRQLEVQQIFFVEKGIIRSAVNMVSPQFSVTTPAGTFLGTGNVFTTAFNDKKQVKKSVIKKSVKAGETTIDFDKLTLQKQVYGLGLPSCIWPYLDSRYKIIRLDSNRQITKKDINVSLAPVEVPSYDEEGNLNRPVTVTAPLTPDSFTVGEIEQEWFYHKKKNIIFSRISSLTLHFSKTPLLKIVLK